MNAELPWGPPLGTPLPLEGSPTSVSLPRWADVIGYEESVPAVVSALRGGYPRFVWPEPLVRLNRRLNARHGGPGTEVLALPSHRSAERCAALLAQWTNEPAEVIRDVQLAVSAVRYPVHCREQAGWFIQHVGELLSARAATAVLDRSYSEGAGGADAKAVIRRRIAELEGVRPDQVYLFPTGMAALAAAHRALRSQQPNVPTIQFGFPYVDLLKLQLRAGGGAAFFPAGSTGELPALERAIESSGCAGVFTELPSNPLLRIPPLNELAELLRRRRLPLIVDATIAGPGTTSLRGRADGTVFSLTKYFSGRGDVMGGALIVHPDGPAENRCWEGFCEQFEDLLHDDDAVALERNSRGYPERIAQVGATSAHVARVLATSGHALRIHQPHAESGGWSEYARDPERGCGLFTIELDGGEQSARIFYDSLRGLKGPGFGYERTIAGPVVLLAHYRELDWAAECGVAAHLIRVSVGLEDPEVICRAYLDAAAETERVLRRRATGPRALSHPAPPGDRGARG